MSFKSMCRILRLYTLAAGVFACYCQGCSESMDKADITPAYVADHCDVYIMKADPDQDEFCEGKRNCYISGGNAIGCPHACSCVCFRGMTFISGCTAVECPPETDYLVCW